MIAFFSTLALLLPPFSRRTCKVLSLPWSCENQSNFISQYHKARPSKFLITRCRYAVRHREERGWLFRGLPKYQPDTWNLWSILKCCQFCLVTSKNLVLHQIFTNLKREYLAWTLDFQDWVSYLLIIGISQRVFLFVICLIDYIFLLVLTNFRELNSFVNY